MKNCKLIIRDEVNVKFEGLDLDTRRALVKKFEYEIPGAKYLPSVRLGRWNGKISYFQLGGSTYINLLDEIIPVLEESGYDIELEDTRQYRTHFEFNTITDQSFSHKTWPTGHPIAGQPIVLRDYQVEIINNFLVNPQSIQEVATGAGKCQPYSSKVLTSNGWVEMGSLNVGDRVTTPSGKSANILKIYEPGTKDVYELKFADGRTARACEDHIWKVHNIGWRSGSKRGGPWRHITTKELIELKENTKRAIGLPLITMEQDTIDRELPMDPWLLGFLLGDGSFRHGRLSFSTADLELVPKIESKLMPGYKIKRLSEYEYSIVFTNMITQKNALREHFKTLRRSSNGGFIKNEQSTSSHHYVQTIINLGLNNKLSHEKFIPREFFSGSLNQRMELIRGLIDSDGHIGRNGCITFCSTSESLAKDFQEMIWSVGGLARIKEKTSNYYTYNEERRLGKKCFVVSVRFPRPRELSSLQRKIDKASSDYQYQDSLKLKITDIVKISTEPVRCIYIDDPEHLYVTDNYVVTHNTIITAALSYCCESVGRTIVIVPNKSLVTQTEADYRNLGLDVGVYFGDRKEHGHKHTICTWQSLNNLLKNTKEGETDITIYEFIEGVVCVMVDEAHSVKSDALKTLLSGIMSSIPIRWGLTGTIPKDLFASQALFTCIGPVINKLKASELQEAGVLSQCHVNIVQMQDHAEFRDYQSELSHLLSDKTRLDTISKLVLNIVETGNTLILVDRVAAGEELVNRLPNSVFIRGKTKLKERKEEYDEVAISNDKIIVATYGVAAVGINIPRIFNLVLLEPGKSFVRVVQSIGRGIRKAEDKDFVQIWDVTSTCRFAKRHLTKRKEFYREQNYPYTLEKLEY